MYERLRVELKLVEICHGPIQIASDLSWLIIPCWRLPVGWSKPETTLLVLIPPGYPMTPPDNFFVDPELRLPNGSMPGNTSMVEQAGRRWLQFSYHVGGGDWKPDGDPDKGHNLLSFLQGINKRLREIS